MQTHRMAIIEAAYAALNDATSAGGRVYKSRQLRIGEKKLPALQVYLDDEVTAVTTVGGPRRKQRQSELVVVAVVDSSDDDAQAIESLIGEVEVAIETSNRLGGTVKSIEATGLRFPESEAGKRASTAEAAVGFRFTFYTREGDPSAAL